jgi:hypothetical protein
MWQGFLSEKGYGKFNFLGKNKRTHRIAFELEFGFIPEGLLICHICDNPACCNPLAPCRGHSEAEHTGHDSQRQSEFLQQPSKSQGEAMTALTTTNNQFAPATIDEAMRLSEMLSKSSMVPRAYQGKPEDILVATIWGREMGLATLQALQNIAVINGKPSVYGDAMMALVQASPHCEDIEEYFEGEGTPNPTAVCVAKRKGRKPVVAKFSVEDAKRAGLWGKQGPWQAYPKRMMQMRARGFALRDAFPDALKGLITVEEAQDFPPEAKPQPAKNITPLPSNPLDRIAPPPPPVDEYVPDLEEAVVELQNVPAESAEPAAEPNVLGSFQLMVPGKDGGEPVVKSTHATQLDWSAAYEELADKTMSAGKASERDRMTALKNFKEANQAQFKRMEPGAMLQHSQAYQKRLRMLGAEMNKEKNPD